VENTPKTILITGSTSGIGKAAAIILAKQRHKVVLVSRNNEKLKSTQKEIKSVTKLPKIEVCQCDLSSQKSIRKSASILRKKYPVIDVLITNAAIHNSRFELTEDGIEKTFATNHLGYFLLTGLLLPNIKNSPFGHIINVSSNGHRWTKIDLEALVKPAKYNKYKAYMRSKLANIMFTIDLAERLNDTNIRVNSLHPGLVYTNIGMDKPDIIRKLTNVYKKIFAKTPEEGVETIIYLTTSVKVKNLTGKYFVGKKITKTSLESQNKEKREALWTLSEKLVNFKFA